MVNLNSSTCWRVVDIGHTSLRWRDELLLNSSEATAAHSAEALPETPHVIADFDTREEGDVVTTRRSPHESLLNLCELELHQQSLKTAGHKERTPPLFAQWSSLARLCTSRSLGAVDVIRHPDNSMWVQVDDEDITPRALLARWLSEHLPPEVVLGEEPSRALINGLLWVRSTGHSPLLNARIYQALSELPFPQGGSLSQDLATLMGALSPERLPHAQGIWGVLDVGAGSASWSLIEVSASNAERGYSFQELSSYRQQWVGEQALMRALLNDHLNQRGLMWRELTPHDRREWSRYARAQAAELMRLSWPSHLQHKLTSRYPFEANSSSDSSVQVFKRFQRGTYLALTEWMSHSLAQHHIGPEALRGIWVTGLQGGALVGKLRRLFASVNMRIAPPEASLIGAQRFVRFALTDTGRFRYRAREVSRCALKLYDHHEEVTRRLFKEQTTLPIVIEAEVGPTRGTLSLQLTSYKESPMVIATHPPLNERRVLRVYYEGPHLFELEWVGHSGEGAHAYNTSSDWKLL